MSKQVERTTKEELNKKLEELRSCLGALTVKPTLGDLMAFFKESFNKDIVKVGDRLVFDFTQLFFMTGNKGELYKRFKGKPIQPITVTYIRGSVIFYTYDSEKDGKEEYMDYNSDCNKYLLLTSIKQSELFKNKMFLKEKDFDEFYLQVNFFEINDERFKYIRDLNYE